MPPEVQNYAVWSAALHAAAAQAEAARAFLQALVNAQSAPALGKAGMEPK